MALAFALMSRRTRHAGRLEIIRGGLTAAPWRLGGRESTTPLLGSTPGSWLSKSNAGSG
jgi:hypothetical protein